MRSPTSETLAGLRISGTGKPAAVACAIEPEERRGSGINRTKPVARGGANQAAEAAERPSLAMVEVRGFRDASLAGRPW
jgi:hypothetical protein